MASWRPLALLLWLAFVGFGSPVLAGKAVVRPLDGSQMRAVIDDDGALYLEVLPQRGEGLYGFARRLTGDAESVPQIVAANEGREELVLGRSTRIPMDLLTVDYQARLLDTLFPGDIADRGGWRHQIQGPPVYDQTTLWRVAEWLTGKGEYFKLLREVNELVDDTVTPGQTLFVPAAVLRPALRRQVPPDPVGAGLLDYRADEEEAVYRLRPGEALYSSVVVRFTGRIYADDVNRIAGELAEASDIEDVTDIPIGYPVRIPFDLLLPEYLPAGHPRRQEYEAGVTAARSFSNPVRSRTLEGITVVLDAGHGGKDVGVSISGVWESTYVYDIMMRVKTLLESVTAARVVPTTRDGDSFRLVDRDVLPTSRGHRVLTNPPYPIEDSTIGVNLRWYLANSVHRRALGEGGDPEKTVFVSIHANSLHSSLSGVMVYIPAASLTAGTTSRSGSVYLARAEVREQQSVSFSSRDRTRSEGLSRELGGRIIAAFGARDLPVHPYKPIREKIIRNRREFVPAVLRYNAVPAKVLVEVCNLGHSGDRRLMQTRTFRQRVAEAVVAGLLDYYGAEAPTPELVLAQSGRTGAD